LNFLNPSFEILKEYYKTGNNLKIITNKTLEKYKSQRNDIKRTVYNVVRNKKLIDYILNSYIKNNTHIDLRILIQIGLSLIQLSDSYPEYAIVNEIVNLVKGKKKKFINAVLRQIIRDKIKINKILSTISDLHIKYSINNEIINEINKSGLNVIETLEYLNSPPVFHIKPNKINLSTHQLKEILIKSNTRFKFHKDFDTIEIKTFNKEILKLLSKNHIYLQNISSQLVSLIANKYSKKGIMDLCSAPGTKSLNIALNNTNKRIFSLDINYNRLKMLNKTLQNLNIKTIYPFQADASNFKFKNFNDLILADLPCSSLGTIRKNPDLKYKDIVNIKKINQDIQYNIIKNIFKNIKNETSFLYSVCTFTNNETEELFKRIIKEFNFKMVNLDELLFKYKIDFIKKEFGYLLKPTPELNNDIFYLSLLNF